MKPLKRTLNTEQTKKNFNQVAWFYNLWSRLTESRAAKKAMELADIKNGEHIIEIACGTGMVFKEIAKRNPDGHNLGIDLSPDMLAKARNILAKEDVKKYELRQGDIFNLDIENGSYDKLINNFMIDLMPEENFDEILMLFYKILKPNGVAIISTFSFGEKKVNKFWVWMAKHFPKLLTDCRPVELGHYAKKAGFKVEREIEISQNTFPSKVYRLRKTMV